MTALAGSEAAGNFQDLTPLTQTIADFGRFYIEHSGTGTFRTQTGGAQWSFNWTAPSTDVGTITFFAAGNQANNDGTSDGDQIYFTTATSEHEVAATPTPTPASSPTPTSTPTPTPSPSPSPPAIATIDGQVFTSDGRALRGALVTLLDSEGVFRIATTSSLGFYSFSDVSTNQSYRLSVQSRRYRFEPKNIVVNGNISELNFFGLE